MATLSNWMSASEGTMTEELEYGRIWQCKKCGDETDCILIYDYDRIKPQYCPINGEHIEPCWERRG